MIQSFRCRETEKILQRSYTKRLPVNLHEAAYRKLLMLDAAEKLDDLRVPPGNRLKKLEGNRSTQYSIRINNRWRICFRWQSGNAYDVEIIDYH